MSEDSNDDQSEKTVTVEAGKMSVSAKTITPTVTITPDYDNWIQKLKQDAEDALQIWERGSDISTPHSENVISFFIIASTHIEELSARALYQNGHRKVLQDVLDERNRNITVGDSLDDYRGVRQYDRELALVRAGIITDKKCLEHTRWVRNELAHSLDSAVKAEVIQEKFTKNGIKFAPSKIPEQTIRAIEELNSSLQ